MPKVKQLTVPCKNRPGELARIAKVLGDAKVNILSCLTTTSGEEGATHLVVDNVNKAKKAKDGAEDPQRSLTDDGRKTVEQMADCLSLLGLSLDRIEHSEKLRARQTAEILVARLSPREGAIQIAGLAPNDD